jgi:hypothetical protein
MKKFIKRNWKLLLSVVAIPVGNRVFNHVDAWLGIAIIISAAIFFIYQLFNLLKDEKTEC